MKVIISEDMIDLSVDDIDKLHQIMLYGAQGRHVVLYETPKVQQWCVDTFAETVRPRYQRAAKEAVRHAALFPKDAVTVRIVRTTTSVWSDPIAILSLKDAFDVLGNRLGILLENNENDWNLLLGLLRQSDRHYLQNAKMQQWIEVIHGGGTTTVTQLEARIKAQSAKLRTFLMFDSDRLHPAEFNSAWIPKLPGRTTEFDCFGFRLEAMARQCLGTRYWMLRRRFIESYMPRTELDAAKDRDRPKTSVDAFFRMTREQRFHYNMKDGFEGESIDDKPRAGTLYESPALSEDQKEALKRGFGKRMAKHYAHAVTRDFDWDDEARAEAEEIASRLMRLL